MSSSSMFSQSIQWADHGHHCAARASEIPSLPSATQIAPASILNPHIPLVNTTGWFPSTPRIPLRELPALPLPPQPFFRLHPALTAVMYHWDVRLDPEPTQLTTAALSLPAFDSPPDVQSFRLHFTPLASIPALDYSCDVAVPPGTPISIGDVFRAIHRAVSAPLAGRWAHWRGDPMRRHVERAFRRRTGARADSDVLRNVDLHMAMADSDGRAGLFFHGIVVEQAGGYTVFRVVLREDPPFP